MTPRGTTPQTPQTPQDAPGDAFPSRTGLPPARPPAPSRGILRIKSTFSPGGLA